MLVVAVENFKGAFAQVDGRRIVASRADICDGSSDAVAVVLVDDKDLLATQRALFVDVTIPLDVDRNDMSGIGIFISARAVITILGKVGGDTTSIVLTTSTRRSGGSLLGAGGVVGSRGLMSGSGLVSGGGRSVVAGGSGVVGSGGRVVGRQGGSLLADGEAHVRENSDGLILQQWMAAGGKELDVRRVSLVVVRGTVQLLVACAVDRIGLEERGVFGVLVVTIVPVLKVLGRNIGATVVAEVARCSSSGESEGEKDSDFGEHSC
jgi:hypothetical protein